MRWGYYTRATVRIEAAADAIETYMWNGRRIGFHRCRTCGCVTHWTPNDDGRDKVGVNFRMFDPQEIAGVPVHQSDGPP